MPRKSRLTLPDLDLGTESLGQRLARLRKARGLTQQQLAARIGIIQALISDYETDKLRLSGEMAVRFALALHSSTDAILGMLPIEDKQYNPKFLQRIDKIQQLPPRQQAQFLKMIDTFLSGLQK